MDSVMGEGNSLLDVIKPFDSELAKQAMKINFQDSKTRIKDETAMLVAEVISALIIEAALRSHTQAIQDGDDLVQVQHVEKVLPQLLLDFN